MDVMTTAAQNLLSPFTLFFLLGILAGVLKSSLTIPETVSKSIALYLMIAIGYRGGAELSHNGFHSSIIAACLAAVALSVALPVVAYVLLRWTTRLDSINAAAVSAHYGSVSAVTFATAIAVLNHRGERFEPYILALMAVMEAPAILTGLLLARRGGRTTQPGTPGNSLTMTVHEVLLHGSVFLLLGSFAIGWLTGSGGFEELNYVFVKPFKGVLCVFLLEIGLLVAQRVSDLRSLSPGLVAFGLYMPIIGAAAGLGVALVLGLSIGGSTLLAVLGASASYIVVPAVMRDALPKASPAIYMALALGITFPFNLIVGIPLYHGAAREIVPAIVRTTTAIENAPMHHSGDREERPRKGLREDR
ncbi:MAG: sodium-dependent bicarbonate transport family permease [Nitrospira sp.]|nr:sodium-dependent bicarbonate transport family permease [Nitrospira sp.]